MGLRPVCEVLKEHLSCTEDGNAAALVDPGEDKRSKSAVDSTVLRLKAKEIYRHVTWGQENANSS